MSLNNLKPAAGSKFARKRVGRGPGSGNGKTAGRGNKGAQSRSGYSYKRGFEGGQMPLHRRVPKRGFNNTDFRTEYAVVNLDQLDFYGIDTSGRAHVHRLVEVGAAYNYIALRACQKPPGVTECSFDRLPKHRVEGWIEGHPDRRIALNVRARYLSSFVDQGRTLSGYMTVDATATATLSPRYLLALRADDLLNARPETRDGYFGTGLVVSLVLQGQFE